MKSHYNVIIKFVSRYFSLRLYTIQHSRHKKKGERKLAISMLNLDLYSSKADRFSSRNTPIRAVRRVHFSIGVARKRRSVNRRIYRSLAVTPKTTAPDNCRALLIYYITESRFAPFILVFAQIFGEHGKWGKRGNCNPLCIKPKNINYYGCW